MPNLDNGTHHTSTAISLRSIVQTGACMRQKLRNDLLHVALLQELKQAHGGCLWLLLRVGRLLLMLAVIGLQQEHRTCKHCSAMPARLAHNKCQSASRLAMIYLLKQLVDERRSWQRLA